MMRFIQMFNLLGVLLLALLCGFQWRANLSLHTHVQSLEQQSTRQIAALAEAHRKIDQYAADLDEFRQRLATTHSQLDNTRDQLAAKIIERDQIAVRCDLLSAQCDQLKVSIARWIAAVSARDAALKDTGDQIQSLAKQRDLAISEFNDLAKKYNAIVQEQTNTKPSTRPGH